MPLSIEDVKAYLRVDSPDEDTLISAQISAADRYLSGKVSKTQALSGVDEAGEKQYVSLAEDPLYQQCVKLMVSHWYENRAIVSMGSVPSGIQHTVDAILAHIEGCGDYA